MDMAIRDYRVDDVSAVRTCLIELQEFERALDPRLPAGATIADAYLETLFRRCDRFAGKLFVAEADGRVVGFVSVLGSCRSETPDDDTGPYAYVNDLLVLPAYPGPRLWASAPHPSRGLRGGSRPKHAPSPREGWKSLGARVLCARRVRRV